MDSIADQAVADMTGAAAAAMTEAALIVADEAHLIGAGMAVAGRADHRVAEALLLVAIDVPDHTDRLLNQVHFHHLLHFSLHFPVMKHVIQCMFLPVVKLN